MQMNPVRDNVVVRQEVADEQTPGGLFIPTQAQKRSNVATVVAVGPGRTLSDGSVHECTVKPGDAVLLDAWAVNEEFEDFGIPHLVVAEPRILAVLKEDG